MSDEEDSASPREPVWDYATWNWPKRDTRIPDVAPYSPKMLEYFAHLDMRNVVFVCQRCNRTKSAELHVYIGDENNVPVWDGCAACLAEIVRKGLVHD